MPDLIECTHPDLPGQVARLVKPWGRWTPITKPEGLDALTVPQLRQFAEDNEIDLGDAKGRDEIVDAIQASREQPGQDSPTAGENHPEGNQE